MIWKQDIILEASCVTRVSIPAGKKKEKFIPRTYGNYEECFKFSNVQTEQTSNTSQYDLRVQVDRIFLVCRADHIGD